MSSQRTIDALNRVYQLHVCSLAAYLTDARPWREAGDESLMETIRAIAEDQQAFCERIGDLLLEENVVATSGSFPMSYTGLHDLSASYLVHRLIDYQKRLIAELETLLAQVRTAPLGAALVEESIGAAKGHLQSLEELTAPEAPAA